MFNNFKAGDPVQVKSGGPLMTVSEILTGNVGIHKAGDCRCEWFLDGKAERGIFAAASLEHATVPAKA